MDSWIAKIIGGGTAAVVLAGVLSVGCLTPSQTIAMNEANAASAAAVAAIESLDGQIQDIEAMIKARKIDAEKGREIISTLIARRVELEAVGSQNVAAVKAMQDAQSPWWVYALYGLSLVGGVAGSVGGVTVAGRTARAFGAVSRGIEEIIGDMNLDEADTAKKKLKKHVEGEEVTELVKSLHHKALVNKI